MARRRSTRCRAFEVLGGEYLLPFDKSDYSDLDTRLVEYTLRRLVKGKSSLHITRNETHHASQQLPQAPPLAKATDCSSQAS